MFGTMSSTQSTSYLVDGVRDVVQIGRKKTYLDKVFVMQFGGRKGSFISIRRQQTFDLVKRQSVKVGTELFESLGASRLVISVIHCL